MNGLEATFNGLREAKSEAAEALWLDALNSSRSYIRNQAFQSSLQGAPVGVQVAVIDKWRELSGDDRKLVGRNLLRFLPGLKASLAVDDDKRRANAYAIAMSQQAFVLIPDFVRVIESTQSTFRASAGRVLLNLAETMSRHLAQQTETAETAAADFYRTPTVEALAKSIHRYHQNGRSEVLTAFMLVAPLDCPTLLDLLQSPDSSSLSHAAQHLEKQRYAEVPDRLLVEYLDFERPPELIKKLWERQTDPACIAFLLQAIDRSNSAACRTNLQGIRDPRWTKEVRQSVGSLTMQQQRGLYKLVATSNLSAESRRGLLHALVQHGDSSLIANCVRALAHDRATETDQLVVSLMGHSDPQVEIEVIGQLRSREIPGYEALLINALDHPDESVQQAAQDALPEYNLELLLENFDTMNSGERETTAAIVRRVDRELIPKLKHELSQDGRDRQLCALAIASELELCEQIEDDLLALSECADQGLRAGACSALGGCLSTDAEIALNRALTDESIAVKDAAMEGLERMEQLRQQDSAEEMACVSSSNDSPEAAP